MSLKGMNYEVIAAELCSVLRDFGVIDAGKSAGQAAASSFIQRGTFRAANEPESRTCQCRECLYLQVEVDEVTRAACIVAEANNFPPRPTPRGQTS